MVVSNCSLQERAKRYMTVFAEVMELGTSYASLVLIINMRTVGSKYPTLLAEYKDFFEEKKIIC